MDICHDGPDPLRSRSVRIMILGLMIGDMYLTPSTATKMIALMVLIMLTNLDGYSFVCLVGLREVQQLMIFVASQELSTRVLF
jgi:hypothetical protein